MQKGTKYRIRYKAPTQRLEREAVMFYVRLAPSYSSLGECYVFNNSNTGEEWHLPRSWFHYTVLADISTKCYTDKKVYN